MILAGASEVVTEPARDGWDYFVIVLPVITLLLGAGISLAVEWRREQGRDERSQKAKDADLRAAHLAELDRSFSDLILHVTEMDLWRPSGHTTPAAGLQAQQSMNEYLFAANRATYRLRPDDEPRKIAEETRSSTSSTQPAPTSQPASAPTPTGRHSTRRSYSR